MKEILHSYVSQQADGPIRSVAFQKQGAKQYAFVTADDAAGKRVQELAKQDGTLHFLSQTPNEKGALLVFETKTSEQGVLGLLGKDGQSFVKPEPKKEFNRWKWRGIISFVGQTGQLISGGLVYDYARKSKTGKDLVKARDNAVSLIVFAVLNLGANVINLLFGAQEKSDPKQLAYLKQQFNEQWQGQYGADVAVDAPDKNLLPGKAKVGSFLERNSVTFGEVFLRTLGSVGLVFPLTNFLHGNLKNTSNAFRTKGLKAGFDALKNSDGDTLKYGYAMLIGKALSFMAVEPDPYNPEPPSLIHNFREKVAFKLSSVIEGAGSARFAHDRYNDKTKRIKIGNREPIPDIPGAFGNAAFVVGYGIRYNAPYGKREVYLPEMYAHAGKAIAHLPQDKQADAIATTAQWMAGHFEGEKKNTYRLPSIYAGLTEAVSKQPAVTSAKTTVTVAKQPSLPPLAAPTTSIGHVQEHGMLQQPAVQHDRAIA